MHVPDDGLRVVRRRVKENRAVVNRAVVPRFDEISVASPLPDRVHASCLIVRSGEEQDLAAKARVSGTLVRLRSGLTAVLTAKHVLPDACPVGLLTDGGVYDDAVDLVSEHPSRDVDVALGLLRPDIGRELCGQALPFDQIEQSPMHRIERGCPLVAAGFPSQFTSDERIADNVIEHRFVALLKYTAIHGANHRHVSLDWRTAYPIPRAGGPAHAALAVEPGGPVHLEKPIGLSGGPVYRIERDSFERHDPVAHCRWSRSRPTSSTSAS